MSSSSSTARRDSAFLVLAPDFSSGYPTEHASRSSSMSSDASTAPLEKVEKPASVDSSAVDMSAPMEASEATKKTRRSSSTSSARRGFLKLGPVHFGGDPTESDFVEVEEK